MFTVQLGTVPVVSRLISQSRLPLDRNPKSMTVCRGRVMLLIFLPLFSMRTIVLLCSGPRRTAVYRSPMWAESTWPSMVPL